MKILKFGGTSLKTPERVKHAVQLISTEHPCAVVVSAFGGVTDQLIRMAGEAAAGGDCESDIRSLIDRHDEVVFDLISHRHSDEIMNSIQKIESELVNDLSKIRQAGRVTAKKKDAVLSVGERLSATLIAAICSHHDLEAEFLDARTVILTDDHFGNAFVHYQASYNQIRRYWKNNYTTRIITGFIGATENGETTTFGRSGSDYTAAIFGAALNVDEIVIWTDVDGILTADPSVVSNPKPIPNITYEEAMELAHAGAKVIFPPTMIPALYKSIPIRIKNTFSPDNPGTLITRSRTLDNQSAVGISSIYDIALVRFQGAGIVGRYGIIGRAFDRLAAEKINIILVSQVFSEHSICFAIQPDKVALATEKLHEEFSFELENRFIDAIKIEKKLSLIAVVGEGMRHTPGIAGKLFGILGREKVNIIAITQGSSERNISFIVNEHDVKPAIRSLHGSLFVGSNKLNIFLAGPGLVGSELINLISKNEQLNLCGISNSQRMIIHPEGLDMDSWREELPKGDGADINGLMRVAKASFPSVFVDVTSSREIAEKVPEFIKNGISVVTANKLANAMNQEFYDQIRMTCNDAGVRFLYEANVGAGLPIIDTLQSLLATGDTVIKIQGVMSGTLSYLFHEFDGTVPFSQLVKKARNLGFTEPDPREDLTGMDVARKILILARETGAKLELSDVSVESFIPDPLLFNIPIEDFLKKFSAYDSRFLTKFNHAKTKGKVLRYIATWDGETASVSLQSVGKENPFYTQNGRENFIVFQTKRYNDVPMVIKGHGAGAEVTAAAVLGDILKCVH
ncbi:MAG: bifunctional aspartate kinase/homoserine dehydrogenase I [Fidelibacterota bacterium]